MPVEVVHTFEEKGKSVNVATLLSLHQPSLSLISEMLEYRFH